MRSANSPSVASNLQATAAATCPTATAKGVIGYHVLSGGFSSLPLPSLLGGAGFPLFSQSARSTGKTWAASMTNQGVNRNATSLVYCAPAPLPAQTAAQAPLGGSGPGVALATAVTPACPGKRSLVGGGFSHTPVNSGGSVAPVVTESAPAGRQWRASALNLGSAPGFVGSLGYCL